MYGGLEDAVVPDEGPVTHGITVFPLPS